LTTQRSSHRRDCASNFAAFARKLKLPQTALLVFNGPLPFPSADMPNGRTWYGDDEQAESALLQQCVTELTAVVDALVAHGWRHKQLHLCGFSDGGQVCFGNSQRPDSVARASICMLPMYAS
jgi:predicted esterase